MLAKVRNSLAQKLYIKCDTTMVLFVNLFMWIKAALNLILPWCERKPWKWVEKLKLYYFCPCSFPKRLNGTRRLWVNLAATVVASSSKNTCCVPSTYTTHRRCLINLHARTAKPFTLPLQNFLVRPCRLHFFKHPKGITRLANPSFSIASFRRLEHND